MELANTHSFLCATIIDAIVKFCTELSKSQNGTALFKNQVLPEIRCKITKKLEEMSVDEFFLLAGLRSSFSVCCNFFLYNLKGFFF